MDIRAGSDFTYKQLADCFNDAFKGYIGGDMSFTPEELEAYLPRDNISLSHSLIASDKDTQQPIGFAFMAYRDDLPTHARLAGMGIIHGQAGKGIGAKLLTATIASAKSHGIKELWLEAIDGNTPAQKLYERAGFEYVRRLPGWEGDGTTAEASTEEPSGELEESTPAEVLAQILKNADDDLPWQLRSQFRLSAFPENSRTFKLGPAYCSVTNPEKEGDEAVGLQALVVEKDARGKGHGTALLRAVIKKFPGKKWQVSQIVPELYGEKIAARLGMKHKEGYQHQMRLRIE